MSLNKLSSYLYRAARVTRDVKAVVQSVKTGSLMPIARRLWNKLVGRNIFPKLTWRK